MKKLLISNWKSNPDDQETAVRLAKDAERLAGEVRSVEIAVAPPFTFLNEVGKVLHTASLGAQNSFWEEKGGAYTGEISLAQLISLKVRFVIIGHSERRRLLGETDEMINKKVVAAVGAGLTAVLCVGEPSYEASSLERAKQYVCYQLENDLKDAPHKNVVVAYEPVWAIGTRNPAQKNYIKEMASFIKSFLSDANHKDARIIYGGSVGGKDAREIFSVPNIDGALVGGASLKTEEFTDIIKSL